MQTADEVRHLIREGWDKTSATYGQDGTRQFQRFGERLLALMALPEGAAVLDVGAGTGIVATRVAGQVGPEGRVVGVDLSGRMLAAAQEAGRAGGLSQLRLAQMDAEHLGFASGAFDAVVCAFSLFQFVDMGRALAEMARVVRRGGQVGLSNWGPGYFSPVGGMQRELFREFGLRPLLTNPIAFKPEALRALLEAAGLAEIRLEAEAVELWFESPQDVWDYNMSMGPFPVMLRQQLTPAQRESLRERFLEMVNEIASPQGVRCTFHPLYALAHKP